MQCITNTVRKGHATTDCALCAHVLSHVWMDAQNHTCTKHSESNRFFFSRQANPNANQRFVYVSHTERNNVFPDTKMIMYISKHACVSGMAKTRLLALCDRPCPVFAGFWVLLAACSASALVRRLWNSPQLICLQEKKLRDRTAAFLNFNFLTQIKRISIDSPKIIFLVKTFLDMQQETKSEAKNDLEKRPVSGMKVTCKWSLTS